MQNDFSRTSAIADADLILRTRSGDRGAFGELWRRHYPSGMSVARSITSSIDADDLVQESYTRIYQAIVKGGGPNGSFRAYLFTSIRNTAAAWGRSRRETPIDELDAIADPDSTEQAADEALDRGLTAQAFRGLPTRWQEVLWYTEIERMKPAEVAPLLGMKAGAVAQLAFRAREGLREAWIQAHLRNAESGSECRWTIEHLGAYSRGNLSTRDHKRVDQHIDECARCMIVAAEAKDVSGRLALVLLPLVLGVAGAAGYAATLQGTTQVIAVAAMPSAVFEGGVVVGGAGSSAGVLGLPVDGSGGLAGGAAGGGTGSGVTGGAITGIGALVGAGSAALVVAGVVAAAAIVPGLLDASPATSLPSAANAGDSSISSEVEPDPDAAEDKFVLEIDEEKPAPPAPEDEAPEVELRVSDDAPVAQPAAPTAPATPTVPDKGDGGGGVGSEPTDPPLEEEPDPTDPTDPEEPTDPTDPEEPTDPTDPEEPTDPGDDGEPEPDPTDPTDPPVDPEEPGDGGETGPTDPADPDAPLSWSAASISFDFSTGKTHYEVPITGLTSETVQALINGRTGGADRIVLNADGTGMIDLRPTFLQILFAKSTVVTFRYVTDSGDGHFVETTLAKLNRGPTAESSAAPSPAEAGIEPIDAESASSPVEVSRAAQPEPAVEEQPVEEQPVEEQPVEEQPVEEQPVEEQPVEDTAVEDTAVEEAAVEEAAPVEPVVPAEDLEASASPEETPADEATVPAE